MQSSTRRSPAAWWLLVPIVMGCSGRAVVGGNLQADVGAAEVDAVDVLTDVAPCPAPLASCGGRCTDTRDDRNHCGACGRVCAASEVCQNGACVPNCAPGETLCSSASGGDAGGGELLCVSLMTDRAHCGACGRTCGRDQVCSGGTCTFMCTGGTIECRGATGAGRDAGTDETERYCADVMSDRNNCGACGNQCIDGYTCVDGRCRIRCE